GACALEQGQRRRGGVAVAVAGADADQGRAGAYGSEEVRDLARRAVVRDLEDVGLWEVAAQEPALGLDLDVAAEQCRAGAPSYVQDDARVVRGAAFSRACERRRAFGR